MSTSRGILYIVWGQTIEAQLERSIRSFRRHHPELPVHIERPADPANQGLWHKARMASLSPFESTLYLDADTVVMGKLDFGFEQAERFGLACCLCECPWMRRYGSQEGEQLEYNTGVVFFSGLARPVFSAWESSARSGLSASRWTTLDGRPRGLDYEDQASFARSIQARDFNPFVLPINYNLRPAFHPTVFAPVKIWHDYRDPPRKLELLSQECETRQRPVTLVELFDRR